MRARIITSVLILGIFLVSGCGASHKEPEIVTIGNDDAGMKVGMSASTGDINDESFNQSAWEGLKNVHDTIGARISYIENASEKDYDGSLSRLADAGNDLCWGIGYLFSDAVIKTAKKYPDTSFAIIDHVYEEIPENVTCVEFHSEECAFLVGYIAASVTRTGKIGVICGRNSHPLNSFRYGYLAGAKMAGEELDKDIHVESLFIDTFEDRDKGYSTAKKLYSSGYDVIFQVAGGAGTGVIDAASEMDKYVIGVDCDQSKLAPNNVLTSAVKKVGVAVSNISIQYDMGVDIGGKVLEYGLAEYAVGIPEEHPNYSDELYSKAMELQDKIISGEISVPSTEEEFQEFDAGID